MRPLANAAAVAVLAPAPSIGELMRKITLIITLVALAMAGLGASANASPESAKAMPALAVSVTERAQAASAGLTPDLDPQSSLCNQNTSCYWPSINYGGTQWVAPTCGTWDFSRAVWSAKNYGHGTIYLYNSSGSLITSISVGGTRSNLGQGAWRVRIAC